MSAKKVIQTGIKNFDIESMLKLQEYCENVLEKAMALDANVDPDYLSISELNDALINTIYRVQSSIRLN